MHGRALVADDDPELLDAVAAILTEAGMDVRRATSGVELLQYLAKEGPFDVLRAANTKRDLSSGLLSGALTLRKL